MDFRIKRAAFVIQRFGRGFLVRNRMKIRHRAAFKIQGHFKMKWLSGLFQCLRKNVRIIQVPNNYNFHQVSTFKFFINSFLSFILFSFNIIPSNHKTQYYNIFYNLKL